MADLVLISEAAADSNYTIEHIRYLVRNGIVQGRKPQGIWLVDMDDLNRYEKEMADLGNMRFSSKRGQSDD